MAFLVWDSPKGRVVFSLERDVAILGRDPVSDLHIADTSLSRRHALIERDGARISITDLRSTVGTKINGAQLMPEVPATLEPGDFVTLGRVVLTCHKTPPPATAAPAPAALRPPSGAPRSTWMWVAIALAVVLAGVVGAWIARATGKREVVVPETAAKADPAPAPKPTPKPAPAPAPAPKPQPPPPVEQPAAPEEPPPAKKGALPPQAWAPLADWPELLELERSAYCPARLRDWDAEVVEAVGGDGLLYRIPRGKVTKIEDRADLARRAAAERAGLAPDDADGRLALAAWCARRHVRDHAIALVAEVLALRPGDAVAKALAEGLRESR